MLLCVCVHVYLQRSSVLSVSPPVRSFLITSCGLKSIGICALFLTELQYSSHAAQKGLLAKRSGRVSPVTRWTGLRLVLLPPPSRSPGRAFLIPCQMPFVCLPCFCFLVCNGESRDPTNDNCPRRERFMKPNTQTCRFTITTGEQTGSHVLMWCYCVINAFYA